MDQLNKIKVCFLISGYGTNLFKVLTNLKNDKKRKFLPSAIISNNKVRDEIKNIAKKVNQKIKIYEDVKNLNSINFTILNRNNCS